jgi:hypothetical protein
MRPRFCFIHPDESTECDTHDSFFYKLNNMAGSFDHFLSFTPPPPCWVRFVIAPSRLLGSFCNSIHPPDGFVLQ